MKIVLFGGGSHRYLGITRSILAAPGLMNDGEIALYDLAIERAEAVGRMAMKSPEYAGANCRITWGTTLDQALEGADIVFVVLMAGSRTNFHLLQETCPHYGFIGSDQLSPSGAILALKGGPILMDLARRMEQRCPDAWLIDFANPVAVLSAAINNHTRIRCLGVCAGYTNHQWDLARMLSGRDEQWTDFDIRCAGVNHMNFILRGSRHGDRDLYEEMAERRAGGWPEVVLSSRWNEATRTSIASNVHVLRALYAKYECLVFSSESDGLAHLDMEGVYWDTNRKKRPLPSAKELEAYEQGSRTSRKEEDGRFRAWLDVDLSETDWNRERPGALYLLRVDEDIMVKIAKALGGIKELVIATSHPNRGAVRGFTDRTVLEYSQVLNRDGIQVKEPLEIPDLFQGLVTALATHQTLLGDAVATRDPRILFEALYSYPVLQDSVQSKALWCRLLELARDEIPAEFQTTRKLIASRASAHG